ncbi:hypothetical protein S83_036441, partial [Arachis hypogaea]
IRKIKLEARSLQESMKASLLVKLREYKTNLNNLKSELKRITSAANNNDDEFGWYHSSCSVLG